ncbi:hypothetical protein ACFRIB_38510 [Streptomyces mirabilis]|uniref:hypothetical protein n=1 Tax=Streptomyces mirabilis TaxID=68239 RepID=UPI0036866EDD
MRAPTADRASRSQIAGSQPDRGRGAPSAINCSCAYWWPCSWRRIFCAVRSLKTVPSGRSFTVRAVARPAYTAFEAA